MTDCMELERKHHALELRVSSFSASVMVLKSEVKRLEDSQENLMKETRDEIKLMRNKLDQSTAATIELKGYIKEKQAVEEARDQQLDKISKKWQAYGAIFGIFLVFIQVYAVLK